jgi:WD40 repeat protein
MISNNQEVSAMKQRQIIGWQYLLLFVVLSILWILSVNCQKFLKISQILSIKAHESWISSLTFAPNGEFLVSGSFDKTIKIWYIKERFFQLSKLFKESSEVLSVAISPDGKFIASGDHDGNIKVWRASDGYLLKTLWGHQGDVGSIAFSPKDRILASGGSDGIIKLWKIEDSKPVNSLDVMSPIWSIAFSNDGHYLAFASGKGRPYAGVGIWKWKNGESKPVWIHKEENTHNFFTCVAFSHNNQLLAAGGWDGFIRFWQVNDKKLIQNIRITKRLLYSISFLLSDKLLASASVFDVNILDISRQSLIWQWLAPDPESSSPTTLTVTRDDSMIAVGFSDGSIKLWKIEF